MRTGISDGYKAGSFDSRTGLSAPGWTDGTATAQPMTLVRSACVCVICAVMESSQTGLCFGLEIPLLRIYPQRVVQVGRGSDDSNRLATRTIPEKHPLRIFLLNVNNLNIKKGLVSSVVHDESSGERLFDAAGYSTSLHSALNKVTMAERRVCILPRLKILKKTDRLCHTMEYA